MSNVPRYITGITKEDLAKIFEVANVEVGAGIDIRRENGRAKISVNQNQLKYWIRAFAANGGLTCPIADVASISLEIS